MFFLLQIMVIDENEARLRVRYPLNCEKRRNYKFDIAAVGCDGSYSNTSVLPQMRKVLSEILLDYKVLKFKLVILR